MSGDALAVARAERADRHPGTARAGAAAAGAAASSASATARPRQGRVRRVGDEVSWSDSYWVNPSLRTFGLGSAYQLDPLRLRAARRAGWSDSGYTEGFSPSASAKGASVIDRRRTRSRESAPPYEAGPTIDPARGLQSNDRTHENLQRQAAEVTHEWFVIDATDKVLGRVASEVALRLRGKHKAIYTPHVDTGDFIVIVNADKIRVTGNKAEDKIYYRHSGYPGRHPRHQVQGHAGAPPGPRAREGRQGHAAQGPARLRDDQEAEGVCGRHASAHRAAAQETRHSSGRAR